MHLIMLQVTHLHDWVQQLPCCSIWVSLMLQATVSCHSGLHGVQLELDKAAQQQLQDTPPLQLAQRDMCCLRCLDCFPGAVPLSVKELQSCGPRSAPTFAVQVVLPHATMSV